MSRLVLLIQAPLDQGHLRADAFLLEALGVTPNPTTPQRRPEQP